jgi:hypothetical protein
MRVVVVVAVGDQEVVLVGIVLLYDMSYGGRVMITGDGMGWDIDTTWLDGSRDGRGAGW